MSDMFNFVHEVLNIPIGSDFEFISYILVAFLLLYAIEWISYLFQFMFRVFK